jgi:dephospho-CoA kinase
MNKTKKKLVIGLTGGIGSGKSTVAKLFANLGIDIIDTDKIAREIVEPGTEQLKKIARRFGDEILNPNGTLNRPLLRKIIFSDPEAKKWLEDLLHPIIYQLTFTRAKQIKSPYCIVVIPLLIESHAPCPIDRILVIDTSEELQLQRARKRDNLSAEEVKTIIDSQASREQHLKIADDVIENFGDIVDLEKQVKKLHEYYFRLCL